MIWQYGRIVRYTGAMTTFEGVEADMGELAMAFGALGMGSVMLAATGVNFSLLSTKQRPLSTEDNRPREYELV